MKHFYTRWEQRNTQERLELLRKFIKPLFVNTELNSFLSEVFENIKPIDEKIFYLQYWRKVVAQTNRQPNHLHYEEFKNEYIDFFEEIEYEQLLNDPIKWIDAELQYIHFLKSNSSKEEKLQPIDFNKKWLTTKEMATYLGISKSTLERKVAFGLPQEKLGRRVFYSPEKVNDWLAIQNN